MEFRRVLFRSTTMVIGLFGYVDSAAVTLALAHAKHAARPSRAKRGLAPKSPEKVMSLSPILLSTSMTEICLSCIAVEHILEFRLARDRKSTRLNSSH